MAQSTRRRCCLPAVFALLLLSGAASTAEAKPRATQVVGYVSAGGPVKGARMSAYTLSGKRLQLRTKRAATRTNRNGFFHVTIAGRPKLVRLVARGGKLKRQKIKGSLQAFVRKPSLDRTVYLNPVTTVIAAIKVRYPDRSLAWAERKARRLLKLQPNDPIGRALRSDTPDFDGLEFLREALKNGGLQNYIDDLIDEGDPIAFKGSPIPISSFAEVKNLLTSAKNAVSAVAEVGKFAYDFYRWATNEKDTDEKIYEAVQKMQTQLNGMQAALNQIHDELGEGFQRLEDEINANAFANAVAPLQDLAGKVAATQGYFDDIVNNKLEGPPAYSQDLADTRLQDIRANMNEIVRGFQRVNDVFRNGIIKAQSDAAYYYAGQNLLSHSRHFMTPDTSDQLRNFASFVLQYQALAFNLIVRWESHLSPARPTTTVRNAIKLYLGFDDAQATAWLNESIDPEATPSMPPSGDLHDELTYLATIRPVPGNTVVQADGLENNQGPMWQGQDLKKILLGRTIYARPGDPGMGCSDLYATATQTLGGYACQYMAKGWDDGQSQLRDAAGGLAGADWRVATIDQTQALFTRVKPIPADALNDIIRIKPLYWYAPEYTTDVSNYDVLYGQPPRKCDPPMTGCTYYTKWIDQVTVTTLNSDPAKPLKGTCKFGVGPHKGGSCPELYVLLRRETDANNERYWPRR